MTERLFILVQVMEELPNDRPALEVVVMPAGVLPGGWRSWIARHILGAKRCTITRMESMNV